MAEPEAPPRRRFQLHLSTCIIVMVVAGVLVWANAVPRMVGEDTCDGMRGNFMERGWPWSFHERTEMIEAFRAKIHAWVPADSIESYQHPDWAFSPTNAQADFFSLADNFGCRYDRLRRLDCTPNAQKGRRATAYIGVQP